MAQFLSRDWFEQLSDPPPEGGGWDEPDLVIEVAVAGAPEGEVRYQLVVSGSRVRAVAPGESTSPAVLRLASDYATISEVARGRLSAFEALAAGRAKISGDTSVLSSAQRLAGLDLVPPALRAVTTF